MKLDQGIAYRTAVEKVFVGIDVHKKSYVVYAMPEGEAVKKWSMPAEPSRLAEKLKRDFSEREILSVYEAGFSGFELHRVLESAGVRSQVVHASSIAVRSNDRVKTDKRDAKKLAEHLAVGMLQGIRIPGEKQELRRVVTRTRRQLVEARSRIMNQIRRRLGHFGHFSQYEKVLKRKDVREFLAGFEKEHELRVCLGLQLEVWEKVHAQILTLNRTIRKQARGCPLAKIYRSFPGVGLITAQILVNELGDMSQFANEKALFCFLGLTPSERSSADRIHKGRISRQGRGELRKCLVECAWVAIRQDPGLRAFYNKVAARSGGKKAIVAVARKIAGHMRAALRKNEEYRRVEKEASTEA